MADTTVIYDEYGLKPEYSGPDVTKTRDVFAVIAGQVEGLPAICLGQRDRQGNEAYRHIWELPGGAWKKRDAHDTLQRRLKKEIGIYRSSIGAAIGPPVYRAECRDGKLIVDEAQAYLVTITRGRIRPNPKGAAIQVAFANCHSLSGFTLLGDDRENRVLRRMGVMIYDGLSVLDEPFCIAPLRNELRELIIGDPEGQNYVLLCGGAYLGLPFFVAKVADWVPGAKLGWNIKIFRRRNPYQPGGFFSGCLDSLRQ